jgi:toxin YoeB
LNFEIVFTSQARKDAKRVKGTKLGKKVKELLSLIEDDPYKNPPPYETLVGELQGLISRRINIQHRLVYQVYTEERVVKVLRMWSHYE